MHFPLSLAFALTTPIVYMDKVAEDLKSYSQTALQQYNEKEVLLFILTCLFFRSRRQKMLLISH
jgi:hypothetical protein